MKWCSVFLRTIRTSMHRASFEFDYLHAVEGGHTEIVNTLVSKDVNVNATDKNGMSALMYAAKFGHAEIVNTLISNGWYDSAYACSG
eukprot:m.115315 g.115315  ORF g.115315 m.115315 type:complete len:87 (+) comp12838_c0_seq16:22-282(+)